MSNEAMQGRTQARDFMIEHGRFWNLLNEILHGLTHHYPESQDQIIGRLGHLSIVLSSYQRLGDFLGQSLPPGDNVRHPPRDFFTTQAQRHENFFGTMFAYACWCIQAHLNCVIHDLMSDRDHSRIMERLDLSMVTWQWIESQIFSYRIRAFYRSRLTLVWQTCRQSCPPPGVSVEPPRSGGPVRSSRVWFLLPPPTPTTPNPQATGTRYHPSSPYPGRGQRGGQRRGSSLPGPRSVIGPESLPDGSVSHGALGILIPPPDDRPRQLGHE